jgi:DNA-binding NarL/FixJ family response regulator
VDDHHRAGGEDPGPLRVLIVEDHRMVAEAIAAHLAENGIEVVATVGSVREAVEAAAEHRPSVVLMDLRLPDGTGVEATMGILEKVADAAVLLVSGSEPSDATVLDALAAGCAGFVQKTRGLADLDEAVRAVRAGKAVVPPEVLARMAAHHRDVAPPPGRDLTARELEVLQHLAQAEGVTQIAREMGISEVTVENHLSRAMDKLEVHGRLEAVIQAMRKGLIRPPVSGA